MCHRAQPTSLPAPHARPRSRPAHLFLPPPQGPRQPLWPAPLEVVQEAGGGTEFTRGRGAGFGHRRPPQCAGNQGDTFVYRPSCFGPANHSPACPPALRPSAHWLLPSSCLRRWRSGPGPCQLLLQPPGRRSWGSLPRTKAIPRSPWGGQPWRQGHRGSPGLSDHRAECGLQGGEGAWGGAGGDREGAAGTETERDGDGGTWEKAV